ncbi:IS66 family insertion sequence element accessory protein TnpB [Vagococcus zengguangii]|uniref:IS66 family insertion sequence element accessory protein TnpB n=1 Tax=Vagococcus zengguangii TaxID=2571750 RepID=A0A4D7CTP6_9ENTE|nr:IS66 family insertion sequence element accessory protein TnpB [Vagococcus zengguangii]QCI86282.1 IS66 family insertion sequence element accessory protein TnpB [Vagococcus zengguangii]TLG78261.1 IS66 family insertion sequence element accessory protein TnpB [Vagococcus zengguangii]
MGLINYAGVPHIFIVCGKTDMRRGIDGLAEIITCQYNLNLFDEALFLFCGGKLDRFKALYWDQDGFVLLYKRLESGKLQWPRKAEEVKQLSHQELRWLLEGLSLQQPKALKPSAPGYLN